MRCRYGRSFFNYTPPPPSLSVCLSVSLSLSLSLSQHTCLISKMYKTAVFLVLKALCLLLRVGVVCFFLFSYGLVVSSLAIISIMVALLIADFICLPYFSGFSSGLKSHVLISHDYLSQSKLVPLHVPQDRAAICSRPAAKQQKKFCFVSKQACIYCIRSEG